MLKTIVFSSFMDKQVLNNVNVWNCNYFFLIYSVVSIGKKRPPGKREWLCWLFHLKHAHMMCSTLVFLLEVRTKNVHKVYTHFASQCSVCGSAKRTSWIGKHHISRDAQSTEQSIFYGFLSLVSVYRQKMNFWTNLRILSYSVRLLPPPPPPPPTPLDFRDSRCFACAGWTFFGYYPSPDTVALSILALFRACRVNFFRLLPPLDR